eukprot:437363-Prymnesium_polylepis.2
MDETIASSRWRGAGVRGHESTKLAGHAYTLTEAPYQIKPQDERAAHDAPGTKVRLVPLEADPVREVAHFEPEMCGRSDQSLRDYYETAVQRFGRLHSHVWVGPAATSRQRCIAVQETHRALQVAQP